MIYQLFVLYFMHKFWRPANASVDYDSCDCFITAEQIKISLSDTVLMNWCWSRVFVWQVMSKFQRMRQEQRSMASKAAELEMEINEHRFVANIPPLHIWSFNNLLLTQLPNRALSVTVLLTLNVIKKTCFSSATGTKEVTSRLNPLGFNIFFCSFVFSSSLVIDTLKDVDPSRKCFRLVGGVLVERTVKEVLPALETNKEQVMV